MSPTDDTFMSGSLDNSVRLWDLRTPNCSGIMQVQGKPVSRSPIIDIIILDIKIEGRGRGGVFQLINLVRAFNIAGMCI